MVGISTWRSDLIPGVFCPKVGAVYPRLPSCTVSYKSNTVRSHDCIQGLPRKVPGRSITHLSLSGRAVKCASFVERKYQYNVSDDEDPFLISAMKKAIWYVSNKISSIFDKCNKARYCVCVCINLSIDKIFSARPLLWNYTRSVKSVLLFLVEQPGQLKYIEWPGFQSTLKTATLALVLMGLFIVALSSIDSALSYVLTLFLRRPA